VFTSDFEDFPAEPVIPLPDQTASASSSARASLAQGAVGVSAGGTYLDRNSPSSGQAGGTGNAFAQDSDTLHFTVAGATPSTVTNIPITFTVDGDFSVATAAGDSQGSILSILQINGSHFDETWSSSGASSYIPVLFSGPTVSGWVSSGFSSNTSSLIIFNGVFSITGPTADVNVAEALSGSAGLGTSIDYSNTASLAYRCDFHVRFRRVPHPGARAGVRYAASADRAPGGTSQKALSERFAINRKFRAFLDLPLVIHGGRRAEARPTELEIVPFDNSNTGWIPLSETVNPRDPSAQKYAPPPAHTPPNRVLNQ
jgi:hypothetical protein